MKTWMVWTLAVIVTLASAVYQRRTGPTRPVRGGVTLGGQTISLKLPRTHEGETEQIVSLTAADPALRGEVVWRRFPTTDPWHHLRMVHRNGTLEAALPGQPPAGKLEYQLRLSLGEQKTLFPSRPAIIRFKGPVSLWLLAPHVFLMFLGMVFSNGAGLESLRREGNPRPAALWALILIALGGFLFGPLVQKAAFNAYWTGVPFGYDLTDNKTLIAGLAWSVAVWTLRGRGKGRGWVRAASLVTLVVFAIPHSVWGSEIDWNNVSAGAGP